MFPILSSPHTPLKLLIPKFHDFAAEVIFAHEAKSHGKSVLVVDKRPNIAGNISTEKVVFGGSFLCLAPFMPGFINNELWFMRRLPEVVLGMLFAKYLKNPNWKTSLAGCVIGGAGLSIASVFPDKVTYDTIICTAAFLALAGIAEYMRKGPIEKLVSNVSKYSYAVFLCHHYIIFCAVQYLHLDWLQQRDLVVLYIAHIAATAFVSTLLYRAEKIVCHVVSKGVHDLLAQTKAPV